MENKQFSLKNRAKSFKYAFNGIRLLLTKEHNAWIHCAVAVIVIVFGFLFDISANEWLAIVIAIGAVLAAEGFNTAIERLADVVSPEYNEGIKSTKDIAAGAVLILAIAAVVVGLIVFVPKLMEL